MSKKSLFLDANADWILGAAANSSPKSGRFRLTYLDNFPLAHDSRDYGAHLGAFLLKIDWLEKKVHFRESPLVEALY